MGLFKFDQAVLTELCFQNIGFYSM